MGTVTNYRMCLCASTSLPFPFFSGAHGFTEGSCTPLIGQRSAQRAGTPAAQAGPSVLGPPPWVPRVASAPPETLWGAALSLSLLTHRAADPVHTPVSPDNHPVPQAPDLLLCEPQAGEHPCAQHECVRARTDTQEHVHAPLGTGLQTRQLLCWAERLERSGRPPLSPAQLTVDSAGSGAWTSL